MLARLSCVHAQAVVRCASKDARLSQVRPRDNRANFMRCRKVCGSSLHGNRETVLRHLRAKSVSASSCGSRTNALRILQQSCVSCGSRAST